MPTKLEQLRAMTTVVADTGDVEAIRTFKPVDCTTNPTLVLKAVNAPAGAELVEEALGWMRGQGGTDDGRVGAAADRLAISVGAALAELVPGRVSTEVDADLSFDTRATVEKARQIIKAYEARGIQREKILIKIAATWEGIQAAAILQKEGIDCNLTLVFSLIQSVACADAGVFLISPFVGRILDWHAKSEGRTFEPEEDPGVLSVRDIYGYYKGHGIKTVVMAASFRSAGEVEALAGVDRVTVSPQILKELEADGGTLVRRLDAGSVSVTPARLAADERSFRWAMNENAMATEKLAEGIRQFAKDLKALRTLVAGRLAEGSRAASAA